MSKILIVDDAQPPENRCGARTIICLNRYHTLLEQRENLKFLQ